MSTRDRRIVIFVILALIIGAIVFMLVVRQYGLPGASTAAPSLGASGAVPWRT